MNSIGTINITLEGITPEETERCRKIINKLFQRGVFAIRNGTVEINFNDRGMIGSIKTSFLWREDKENMPLDRSFDSAKIEVFSVK